MSDRVCIRGCVQRDVHYASCEHSGPGYDGAFPCRGCAPRECRDGSLICDKCFGRMRGLLDDAPDLLGRLRSLADPSKSTWNWDQEVVGRAASTEPPAPVGDDLLDAIHAVERVVFSRWSPADLPEASNRLEAVQWLGVVLLDRHAPMLDGTREAWSVQDAVDRWGVERRDRKPVEWEDEPEREDLVEGVREWGNPIVGGADAEGIAGSASTLRRWVKQGHVTPLPGAIHVAGVRTRLFRRDELLACRKQMEAAAAAAQFKSPKGSEA